MPGLGLRRNFSWNGVFIPDGTMLDDATKKMRLIHNTKHPVYDEVIVELYSELQEEAREMLKKKTPPDKVAEHVLNKIEGYSQNLRKYMEAEHSEGILKLYFEQMPDMADKDDFFKAWRKVAETGTYKQP